MRIETEIFDKLESTTSRSLGVRFYANSCLLLSPVHARSAWVRLKNARPEQVFEGRSFSRDKTPDPFFSFLFFVEY